jgi:hypothetical protein
MPKEIIQGFAYLKKQAYAICGFREYFLPKKRCHRFRWNGMEKLDDQFFSTWQTVQER